MECSVDWANKKKYRIYNIDDKGFESILSTREAFDKFFGKLIEKHSFYLEWGGGDTFKLLALGHGHKIFCILGKRVKRFREKLGEKRGKRIKKTDRNDARIIAKLARKYPNEFYEFKENDKRTLIISLLSKELNRITEDSTRKKNQLIAFERMMELLISERPKVAKMVRQKKRTIESLQTEIKAIKVQLKQNLRKHPLWIECLKDVKGIGEVAAGGIIGSVKRFSRFPNKYALRHFAGMITKKDNPDYNRQLKYALYIFIDQIVRQKIQPWRKMYDSIKKYYKKKRPNETDGKMNAYAKKFVQTKFLDGLWKMGIEVEVEK